MKPRELDIEDRIRDKLKNKDIYPFSILCTFCLNGSGLLAITFYSLLDLTQTLDLIDYSSQCDKSGYLIAGNTLILSDLALISFYSKL